MLLNMPGSSFYFHTILLIQVIFPLSILTAGEIFTPIARNEQVKQARQGVQAAKEIQKNALNLARIKQNEKKVLRSKIEKYKQQDENHTKLIALYEQLGFLHDQFQEHKCAIDNYEKALAIRYQKVGSNKQELIEALSRLGILYNATKQYKKAINNNIEALNVIEKILENIEDEKIKKTYTDYQFKTYMNIAGVYIVTENYKEAISYYLSALEVANKLQVTDDDTKIKLYYYLAFACYRTHKLEKTIEYCKEAEAIGQGSEEVGNAFSLKVWELLGDAYFVKKKLKEAEAYYAKTLKEAESLSPPDYLLAAAAKKSLENVQAHLVEEQKQLTISSVKPQPSEKKIKEQVQDKIEEKEAEQNTQSSPPSVEQDLTDPPKGRSYSAVESLPVVGAILGVAGVGKLLRGKKVKKTSKETD